jgi:PhnB protein
LWKENDMTAKPIPEGFRSITPYLSVNGAAAAIDFYKRAFGAIEQFCLAMPDGKIAHAQLRIGDSVLMLDDTRAEGAFQDPRALGGTTMALYVYVEDVDALYARAVEAGAEVVEPVKDQFYGDRSGAVKDPYGHMWYIATHREDVSEDEVQRRAEALFSQVA